MSITRFTSFITLGILALSLVAIVPSAHAGAPSHTPKKSTPVPSQYECQKCHMRYSAAAAKKNKYVDPMDGGKLTPMKVAAAKATTPKSHQPKK